MIQSENTYSRTAVLILCVILVAANVLTPYETKMQLALSSQSLQQSQLCRLTYMLFHANAPHLILNVYAMLVLVFLSNASMFQLLTSIAIAAALPEGIIGDIPILGISVASYALTGMVITSSPRFWMWFVINALIIACQMVIPGMALAAHAFGFAAGLAVGIVHSVLFTPRYE